MKTIFCTFAGAALAFSTGAARAEFTIDAERKANTVILDATGVANLGIETEQALPKDFETTVFAIGRLEEIPARRSVLSSRIAGRAVKVNAFVGDAVEEGEVLVEVESRQPGNPPPVIGLRAPRAGLVIESHVRLGQPVDPDAELLDISDRSMMWAVAKIPESEAAAIPVGTAARLHIPALGDELIEAKLTRFGVAAGQTAGTVEGVFELPNVTGEMRPGMRVEFSVITGVRKGRMAVPREALQGSASKRFVFVRDFELENAFVKAPVVVGEQNEHLVEIKNGLFPGDDVVTTGSYGLAFAGAGSISLKEALDAAHGHEHNEDGSEITPQQKAATAAEASGGAETAVSKPLLIYAVVVTLLFLGAVQMLVSKRKD